MYECDIIDSNPTVDPQVCREDRSEIFSPIYNRLFRLWIVKNPSNGNGSTLIIPRKIHPPIS